MLKSTPMSLFNSKFLHNILSTQLYFYSQVLNYNFYLYLLYQCLNLASSMTPCIEYLTDRIFSNSLKYYVFVQQYMCHTQI